MKLLFSALCILLGLHCASPVHQDGYHPDIFATITERDLIPEGTAYDPVTMQVFISGMYKRKIIAIRNDGSYYDFVKEGQDSIWATLGMEVDSIRHKLWVISAKGSEGIPTNTPIEDGSWEARLYCYDILTGLLDHIYQASIPDTTDFCFNDLTVSSKGDVYLTESLTNRIFILSAGDDSIKVFSEPSGYSFLNGITLSLDEKILFVSSTESLLRLSIESGEITPIPYEAAIHPRPVDGLTYFNNSLIGHQSKMVTRFYLNETMDSIRRHEIIDSSGLDSSTTGEVGVDNWYYYISNSQIRSGIDYSKMEIKPLDSLENIIIKRVRL